MYCIRCGVELADGQTICPICETKVCHPDFHPEKGTPSYPKKEFQSEEFNRKGILFVITILSALVAVLTAILDFSLNGGIEWSGYAVGAIVLGYIIVILPTWFRRANPVIFVPCDFAAAALYLLYIDLYTSGGWFLTFALPVTGALCVIVSAAVSLLYYVRRGRLYTVGGMLIALGGWTVLIEIMLHVTFDFSTPVFWSPFSAISFAVFGLMLIVIAIVKPLRESFRKVFYLG